MALKQKSKKANNSQSEDNQNTNPPLEIEKEEQIEEKNDEKKEEDKKEQATLASLEDIAKEDLNEEEKIEKKEELQTEAEIKKPEEANKEQIEFEDSNKKNITVEVIKYLILIVSSISLCLSVLYLGYLFGKVPNPFQRFNYEKISDMTTTVQQGVQSELTPEASKASDLKGKKELKIEILNGTGTAGLAAKISSSLKKLGFENIKVGNFSGETKESTLVKFSSKVPLTFKEEIFQELKKTFKSATEESTESANFDISIITGELTSD